jgi:hypothetical protein
MTEKRLRYARTGHRDCCGEMIRRRDTVITRDGEGRVVWVVRKWWIVYPGHRAEALNKYPAGELRRVTEEATIGTVPTCDNDCDNAVTTVCDNNPLSHVLSHPLSQPKLVEIQRINP